MKTIFQQLKIIVLAMVIGLGLSYAMAWTGPISVPPADNIPAPINTGSAPQAKQGIFETYNDSYFATLGGNVGIGTANPARKLEVISGADDIARFTGTQGFLDISNIAEGGIRLSTDGTGPFQIRAASGVGGGQFVLDASGNVSIAGGIRASGGTLIYQCPQGDPDYSRNQCVRQLSTNSNCLMASGGNPSGSSVNCTVVGRLVAP